jgi:hypothetical protein
MSLRRKWIELAKKLAGTHYIDASDEFINWLMVSNAGMQHRGNIACFKHAIENLPDECPILEIGAHAGLSANIMCYLLRKLNKTNQVISVDPWIVRGYHDETTMDADYLNSVGGETHISRLDYAEFIKESYLRNTAFFSASNLPLAFRMTSDDFFQALSNEESLKDIRGNVFNTESKFSFVYIDGNHDYDYALRDFQHADKNVVNGGFILFDDTEDASAFGCARLARELEKSNDYRLVMKNPNRLFIKIR